MMTDRRKPSDVTPRSIAVTVIGGVLIVAITAMGRNAVASKLDTERFEKDSINKWHERTADRLLLLQIDSNVKAIRETHK